MTIKKSLPKSYLDRRNILNNQFALAEIQKATNIKGILFENEIKFTIKQVAAFYEVSTRTIERLIQNNKDELLESGFSYVEGKRLVNLKKLSSKFNLTDIDVGQSTKKISLFNFKAFLNIGMLLVRSERARLLRKTILDIVIDVINIKTGGGTKYINQRDSDFLLSSFVEDNYRKTFTDALNLYVDMGNFKYPLYTNKIYTSIFKEKANEYKLILKLKESDSLRDTFYAEILDLIASYECGLAELIKTESLSTGKKLTSWEVDSIFKDFEKLPHWKPLIDKARIKMASRDLVLREALHFKLKEYIKPLDSDEFERFLGEKSKSLAEQLDDAKDVLKRLKDRE